MEKRPDFKNIKSYQEFDMYYWYRGELKEICKELGIDYTGMKSELNHNIEEYFKGNLIKKGNVVKKIKSTTDVLTLETGLLECGFCFNQKFRDFFSKQTGEAPLRQPAHHRHLAPFEIRTWPLGTGFLAFLAPARCLAKT